MKEIILYNKDIALVDDEDYEWLKQYKWNPTADGYAQTDVKINEKWINKKMHRLIMNTPKGLETDHIDHNKLNNQKYNLRIVTLQQNQMNRVVKNNNSSKFKGVSWHKRDKIWQSRIQLNGKPYHLGSFKNEIDAAKAYNEKAKKLFGKYAYLNEV